MFARYYYSHENPDDTLILRFSHTRGNETKKLSDNIEADYLEGKMTEIRIASIGDVVRFKKSGRIALPGSVLVSILNNMLKAYLPEELEDTSDSGFVIARVKEVNKDACIIDDGDAVLTLHGNGMKKGDSVVYDILGKKLATYGELGIEEEGKTDDLLILEDDSLTPGTDFYTLKQI